jgi:hypothetical protein
MVSDRFYTDGPHQNEPPITELQERVLADLENAGLPQWLYDAVIDIINQYEDWLDATGGEPGREANATEKFSILTRQYKRSSKKQMVYCPRCDDMEEVGSSCAENY